MIKVKCSELDADSKDFEIQSLFYDVEEIKRKFPNIKPYEVIKIDVLFHEWECDGHAWVVTDVHGKTHGFSTSHGSLTEIKSDDLKERLSYYQKVVAETNTAISLLEG